jgi:hypothetical protein
MESPNLYASAAAWWLGDERCKASLVNRVLLGLFAFHYINRALIFPMRMRGGKPMPLSVMLMAQVKHVSPRTPVLRGLMTAPALVVCLSQAFCTANGYLQARYLTAFREYPPEWARDVRFVSGVALFLVGWALNYQADGILRDLRKPGETGYKIPQGEPLWPSGAGGEGARDDRCHSCSHVSAQAGCLALYRVRIIRPRSWSGRALPWRRGRSRASPLRSSRRSI